MSMHGTSNRTSFQAVYIDFSVVVLKYNIPFINVFTAMHTLSVYFLLNRIRNVVKIYKHTLYAQAFKKYIHRAANQ